MSPQTSFLIVLSEKERREGELWMGRREGGGKGREEKRGEL